MSTADVQRSVRRMAAYDRRIGHLSVLKGFIEPEQINTVLQEQIRGGKPFGECAVDINLMTPQQVDTILKLQKDDVLLFAQAVVSAKVSTMGQMVMHIQSFLRTSGMARELDADRVDSQIKLESRIRSVLSTVDKVSPLGGSSQRVITMLDDPKVDLEKVGEFLMIDPGMTATLLRVVNSAFYGLRDKIVSVSKATVVLGIRKLRQLVIAATVMQKFQSVPAPFARRFWENSVRTAQWSRSIGRYCSMPELDELFICGLLHNIGEMVIMEYFRPQWQLIDDLMRNSGKTQIQAERILLGGTHADIGAFLYSQWQLPRETVQSAMFHHHDPALIQAMQNVSEAVYLVHMAADIVDIDPNLTPQKRREELDRLADLYADRLNIGVDIDLEKMGVQISQEFDEILASFAQS